MIAWIREIHFRDKTDQIIGAVPHRAPPFPVFPFVQAGMQQAPGLGFVVKNPLAVPPPVSGEKKRHRKVFLAIRRGSPSVFAPVQTAAPGKISRVGAAVQKHIGLCPFPQPVKFIFSVHLHAHHHGIAHALLRPRLYGGGRISQTLKNVRVPVERKRLLAHKTLPYT